MSKSKLTDDKFEFRLAKRLKRRHDTQHNDIQSISPTFYEQLLRQNPLAKKLQTQIVST
jgi:hypothetical protein